jgi:tRNA threonylcarbamoyl adenosine modification protein YeaZ
VLAIETSTRRGGVALWRGGLVFLEQFAADRSHNALVFGPLGAALEAAGHRIDAVVVGTGPGSYTGARVGVAAAQGVSMATGAPVLGVPSPCAAEVGGDDYLVVGDARRGGIFVARVVGRRIDGEIAVLDRAGAEAAVAEGRRTGPVITFDPEAPVPGVDLSLPSAALLVQAALRAGLQRAAGAGEAFETAPVEPLYLASPFVTEAKPRGLAT